MKTKKENPGLEMVGVRYHPETSDATILKDINLNASCGLPVIIAGASGSGKTSLVEIISGITKPQKGKIFFNPLL